MLLNAKISAFVKLLLSKSIMTYTCKKGVRATISIISKLSEAV